MLRALIIRNRFIPVLFGGLMLLTGFVVGRFTAPAQPHETVPPILAEGIITAMPVLPSGDVTGQDIPGLPRYPESMRIEYRQTFQDDLLLTEVQYVTTADFETVHEFYRQIFNTEGWLVADVNFYQREWTFLLVAGSREAILEVEAEGSLVEVEIEISEPQSEAALLPATEAPRPEGSSD